jgi:uroporphyrinogen-III synthase
MAGMGLASSRILFPAGNLVRSDLRTRLEAAGARVEQVTAYSVVPPGDTDVAILDTLRTGLVDVVTFSSPSAFHNLVTLLGESDALRKVGLACIGPTTAEAVRAGGLEPVCVAPTPTPDAFAGAISAAWRATRGVARESERESRA